MKYNELTETMRKEIANIVKTQLMKRGINVDVAIFGKQTRSGSEFVGVKTSPFQTTPVIYKEICIEGGGSFDKVEGREDVFILALSLDFRMTYFTNAYNGVTLGTIFIRIFKDRGIAEFMYEM